ncbi:AAA family ATPase [Streptomyces sp. NPDC051658]|uniref:AAA family ATPase n=1 Tax=Streptomyces sp. NPDC051658 TaxID=3365667 RepID=UPI00379BCE8A
MPRPQRRRQDHRPARDPRPGRAHRGHCHRQRCPLPQPPARTAARRRTPRRHPGPRRTQRRRSSVRRGPQQGIPLRRVDEVLQEVGLADPAARRIGGFSLGMKQRLGVATALLGDPPVLMFDEPVNGMDPEGVLWMRRLFRRLAAEGRTVFLSSHLMSEMENTADQLVVIGRGRLIAAEPVRDFAARSTRLSVLVGTPQAAELAVVLTAAGASVQPESPERAERLAVTGLPADRIGALAFENRIMLHELTTRTASLEEAFMELTADSVEYLAGQHR